MLTPKEFKEVMDKIELWSYETEVSVNESENTYCPSDVVCNLENIYEVLKEFTLPF